MKILLKEVSAEIEEKKSRFIAFIKPIKTSEDAENFINQKKKEYWDARHNCSAFVIGAGAEVTRCSDDGEPSGTAGRPMLEVLLHSEVRNVVVVVTRYFGGTLLGTGGLIRAYQESVKLALESAINDKLIAEEIEGLSLNLTIDYTLLGKIQYYLSENDISQVNTDYTDNVTVTIQFPKDDLEMIKKGLTEATSGKISFSEPVPCTYYMS